MTHLLAPILSKLDSSDHLLVYEIGADRVLRRVMPRREYLLAEEEAPGSVALLGAHFLGILLTLGYGVHDVVSLTSKTGDLREQEERL